MIDPSLELQKALVATLQALSPQPAGGRVYDIPPNNPTFPYVTLGPSQMFPDKYDCIDGVEVYPQIDVWSRAVGYPECKAIVKQILFALDDQAFAVDGFQLVIFQIQDVRYIRDPDGRTDHGVLTFHGMLTPA